MGIIEPLIVLRPFPNPASDRFFVEIDLPETMEVNVVVVNMLGQRVAVVSENEMFQKGKNLIQVDANEWPSGELFLKITSEDQTAFKRLMKMK